MKNLFLKGYSKQKEALTEEITKLRETQLRLKSEIATQTQTLTLAEKQHKFALEQQTVDHTQELKRRELNVSNREKNLEERIAAWEKSCKEKELEQSKAYNLKLKEIEDSNKISQETFIKTKELEFKLKESELVKLTELKQQQDAAQANLDNERKIIALTAEHNERISALKEEYAEKMNEFKQRILEENYSKLNDSLSKLHSEGTHQSNFIKDLALTMVNKGSPAAGAQTLLVGNVKDLTSATN